MKIEAKQVSDNTFTKQFISDDIELYMSKAVDEETDKHYVVASIKEIKQLNVTHIQYPFEFVTIQERDAYYDNFDDSQATDFLKGVVDFIINNQKEQEKNDN